MISLTSLQNSSIHLPLQRKYDQVMRLGIMQPYLFPYIGYWQLINSVDTFVIMEDLHYIKQGYINRNYILINGEAHVLTLHLIEASQNKQINEIETGDNREQMIKTIATSYKHAPHFEEVFPLIRSILQSPEKNLARFVGNSIERISEHLEIDTKFVYSCDIERNRTLKAEAMVLDICERLNTTHYINAIGGQKLYSKETFKERGITLHFIKSESVEYRQFHNEFVPNLSIIDVMMFNSKETVKEMLEKYILV
jgi:hypothetical protein